MVSADNIIEIGINGAGQLYIKPENKQFAFIWRSASEVHWDEKGNYLYSPKPREWSYLDWYKHIVGAIEMEYGCILKITALTKWVNISDDLKTQILALD